MKLVMTLLVRDEDDILEANLRYHLEQGVDLIIVTDNRSADRTPEILREFEPAEAIRVLHQKRDNYAQARWVSRMARLACTEHGADWVINSDADEFWWPTAGDLKSALSQLPPDIDVVFAKPNDFVAVPDDGRPFHARMTARRALSLNERGQPLLAKVGHRAHPRVWIEQGNHRIRRPGMAPWQGDPPIRILHFPVRTYEQFERKISQGGAAYNRNHWLRLRPGVGGEWRRLYDIYLEGGLRRYYDEMLEHRPAAIAAGLQSGELVRDERLNRRLTVRETGSA